MSITHTEYNTRNRITLTQDLFPLSAIGSLRQAVRVLVASLVAAFERRLAMGRFARFSDHRLQDLGFERDWDGSIIPVTPDPRLPWAAGR